MKRTGNLYEKIYEFENLHNSYLLARRCKRYRAEVLKFTDNLEENLIILQNELIWRSYKQGEYRTFKVYEPKERTIKALPFKDRVLQHAVNSVVEPLFTKGYYEYSYACIRGRGGHSASRTLSKWIYEADKRGEKDLYYLKCDIAKYFDSINHKILLKILNSRIKCPETIKLLEHIIDNEIGVGVPIGNLTSQCFANIYLNELDRFVKNELKVKRYIRYMDDFILLDTKDNVREYLRRIEEFLESELALRLNHKTRIAPIVQGIDFVGYKHYSHRINLRRSTWVRQKKQIKKMFQKLRENKIEAADVRKSLYSILGHVKHANTHKLIERIENHFSKIYVF